jgi:hypothetical protein
MMTPEYFAQQVVDQAQILLPGVPLAKRVEALKAAAKEIGNLAQEYEMEDDAEENQKWAPVEEKEVRDLCEEHGLKPESFLRATDNPNRKWFYAWFRCKKAIQEIT